MQNLVSYEILIISSFLIGLISGVFRDTIAKQFQEAIQTLKKVIQNIFTRKLTSIYAVFMWTSIMFIIEASVFYSNRSLFIISWTFSLLLVGAILYKLF